MRRRDKSAQNCRFVYYTNMRTIARAMESSSQFVVIFPTQLESSLSS